jgi:glycosyltransferase involved in cell wall biosynthesis
MGFRQPIVIIPNGIDVPSRGKERAGSRSVLYIGRLHPKKGLEMLLTAWARLETAHPDWTLTIAGPDNDGYERRVREMSDRLHLRSLRLFGPVYGEAKWDLYRSADVFVLPTHSENFGIAVAEALAAGLPAVVTRGAPWSRLASRNAGWWVQTSVEGIYGGLHQAMNKSSSELEEMGRRGRQWMLDEFSWSHLAGQMSETYRWLVGAGSRPASVAID